MLSVTCWNSSVDASTWSKARSYWPAMNWQKFKSFQTIIKKLSAKSNLAKVEVQFYPVRLEYWHSIKSIRYLIKFLSNLNLHARGMFSLKWDQIGPSNVCVPYSFRMKRLDSHIKVVILSSHQCFKLMLKSDLSKNYCCLVMRKNYCYLKFVGKRTLFGVSKN